MRMALRILGGAGIVILSFWITLTILRNWTGGFEENTNRVGSDYRQVQLEDGAAAAACQAECSKDARCVAWVYGRPGKRVGPKPICYLKDGAGGTSTPDECCTSGPRR